MVDLQIEPIRSIDKLGQRRAPQGNLPAWPCRVLFTGRAQTGKTSSLLNLVRAMLSVPYPPPEGVPWTKADAKRDEKLQRVTILHLDPETQEYDALKDVADRFEVLGVADIIKNPRVLPRKQDYDGLKRRSAIIIEEVDFEALPAAAKSAVGTLFSFVSSHSNVSILASYQSYYRVPPFLKTNITGFVMTAPTNRSEWSSISLRVGLTAELLKELFDDAVVEMHDSISVWPDMPANSPWRLRLNLFGPVCPIE